MQIAMSYEISCAWRGIEMKVAIVHETVSDHDFFMPFKECLSAFELMDVNFNPEDAEQFVTDMQGISGMLCRRYLVVPENIINRLTDLKVVSNSGSGFNVTMAEGTAAAGIALCAIREFSTDEVADHTCMLMLALSRRLIPFHRDVQQKKIWDFEAYAGSMPGLSGRQLGICGFGRIGQAVARRMKAFGMKIRAFDPYMDPAVARAQQVELVSFAELLASSDVITNHMNQTKENSGIFCQRTFKRMEKHPVFINCGRGAAVNEADLLQALEAGDISAAGLDVLVSENPDLTNEYATFLGRDNLIMTPHVAYFSDDSTRKMIRIATDNLKYGLAGDFAQVDQVVNGVTVLR